MVLLSVSQAFTISSGFEGKYCMVFACVELLAKDSHESFNSNIISQAAYDGDDLPEAKAFRLATLRESACVLVDFVNTLRPWQWKEPWLNCNIYDFL